MSRIFKRRFRGFECPRCGRRTWELYEEQEYVDVSTVKRKVGEVEVCANCGYEKRASG